MKTTAAILLAVALTALMLTGCSVAMALSGHPEPNFDAFEVGRSRKQVEIQLGTSISTSKLENGKQEDTYRFEMGNSPNGHRAMMNLYMDLATIGIWELPGTIIEAMMGDEHETTIVYSADDRILVIKGYRPPPPSKALRDAEEGQKKYHEDLPPQPTSGTGPAH